LKVSQFSTVFDTITNLTFNIIAGNGNLRFSVTADPTAMNRSVQFFSGVLSVSNESSW
jgi:hypothetical protein